MTRRSKVETVDLWPYVLERSRKLTPPQSGKLVTHISSVPTESQLISTSRFSRFRVGSVHVAADVLALVISAWTTTTGRVKYAGCYVATVTSACLGRHLTKNGS